MSDKTVINHNKFVSGEWVHDLPEVESLVAQIVRCDGFKLYGLTLEQIRLLQAYYEMREPKSARDITYEKVFRGEKYRKREESK